MSIAGADVVKESVEPSFQDLPGPLSSLHFEKVDLGSIPIAFDRIDVHTKDSDSIKLDIDVVWDGTCDIRLRCGIGFFGVRSIKLNGRLSVLMSPLIDKLPLVSAVQVAFINPPRIELDFTGAAQIADLSIIDDTIRSAIHQTLAGIMVLPNRMLTKLDPAATIFEAYQEPQGIARLTIVGGGGFKVQGRLLNRDVPDVFVKATLGSSSTWKSSTKSNTTNPVWNESNDFILSDDDQLITVDAYDSDDLSSHDDLGIASITVGDLLLEGRMKNLQLKKRGKITGAHIMVNLSGIYSLVPDLLSFESPEFEGPGALCGLLTVLVAQAFNIPVAKEDASVHVKVRWGKKEYSTAAVVDAAGIDALNPSFDTPFLCPLTQKLAATKEDIIFAVMNGADVIGTAEVPFSTLADSPGMMVTAKTSVGDKGAMLQFRVILRGLLLSPETAIEV